MQILLKRSKYIGDGTPGQLFVNDDYFCDTLEPPDIIQMYTETTGLPCSLNDMQILKKLRPIAIPCGEYFVRLEYWTKHENYYPLLLNVPCFTGIFIHGGNTPADTLGCILLGRNAKYPLTSLNLTNSKRYVRRLVEMMQEEPPTDQHKITISY